MRQLRIRLADDRTIVSVPDSLSTITTYVLLEQERWFEKEVAFVRRLLHPGMVVIDIGANYGVYAIPMAKMVGSNGLVIAYEPATATRSALETSRRLNGFTNLEIMPFALSDRQGDAALSLGASSELNALGAGGKGETVRLTTLDAEEDQGRWPQPPDFVKLDAEGEEERILDGGRRFFARHSPLVMFEVKAGDVVNRNLPLRLRDLGFALFRMHPGAVALTPVGDDLALDAFELNLFAAKPDRAQALATAGLLVAAVPTHVDPPDRQAIALSALRTLAVNRHLGPGTSLAALDGRYLDALAGYGVWHARETDLAHRVAALDDAVAKLRGLCTASASLPRLATLARAALDAGHRTLAVTTLEQMIGRIEKGDTRLTEPFWPAASHLDGVAPATGFAQWFLASVLEPFETARGFSSCFTKPAIDMDALARNPFATTQIARRHVLTLARDGRRPTVPSRLRNTSPDNVNGELWSKGGVPGTLVGKK